MNDHEPMRMDRREAIKWMLAASATVSALNYSSFGAATMPPGIGTDPNLLEPIVPWPRTLTPEQLRTVSALCDVIIPEDGKSPSASAVGVPDFLDEWVSAPYPEQRADREQILEGLAWLNAESKKTIQEGICRPFRSRPTTDLRRHLPRPRSETWVQISGSVLQQVPKPDRRRFLHDAARDEGYSVHR